MLHLHLSNRPDALAMTLAALMRADPLPLLVPEYVVAPATGVSRSLGFRLADLLGISTQIVFPFPAAFRLAVVQPGAAGGIRSQSL